MKKEKLKYRLPAELEYHDATWIGWPNNKADWPGKFQPIPWVYGEIVRYLSRGENVGAYQIKDFWKGIENAENLDEVLHRIEGEHS